jgi:hypothetical protein
MAELMGEDIELDADGVDAELLIEWAGRFDTCNGFAFWYQENVNENAVVKDSEWWGGDHCYVYDPDLDATIDATCGQFSECPWAGAWAGDAHPYAHPSDEVWEWHDRASFEEHWTQHMNGPYIV